MSWNIITDDDVLNELTPVEKTALNNIQGATGALSRVLANVIGQVRGSIAAGGYALGTAGTVPDQLRSNVIALARWQWLISFPALKTMQTADRKTAADEAIKKFDLVANQKVNVENPAGSSAASAASGSQSRIKGRMGI